MTLTIRPSGKTIEVESGTLLREALARAGYAVDAPCGGRGTCGKCTVDLDGETVLACQTVIDHDCTVTLPESRPTVNILTSGDARAVTVNPGVELPEGPAYVAAVDIGTTTVVLYLMDARTGELVGTASELNPQTRYGGDVISRIQAALDGKLEELGELIRECLDELLYEACIEARCRREQVLSLTAVGNTAMHHLLLGFSPATLAVAPYQPAQANALTLNAAEYGLHMAPGAKLFTLPCIAGFVGADTVAVALSQQLDNMENITLLLDLGTNGELILGNRHRSVACSTAAGPAFEGANIRFGMRAVPGALDHATWDGKLLQIHTVEDLPVVVGLCGSGLLDLVAALRQAEVIDETGRIQDPEDLDDEGLAGHIVDIDGERCFQLGVGADPVRLTQKDVREVQLAKAAIAAGIELLCVHLGIAVNDIAEVRIAGAFGSFLNPASALEIGLLPRELEGRIRAIGNAAGEGARCAALSADEFIRASEITAQTEFLELASSPDFQDCFVDHLSFEEEDE